MNGSSTVMAQFCPGASKTDIATSGSTQDRTTAYYNRSSFCRAGQVGAPAIANGYGGGNSGLGIILGPGQSNWDISLIKQTRVGGINENASLEFRTEFFNAFNHPQFSNPSSSDLNNSAFGVISATSVNPRLIQFALKYVF